MTAIKATSEATAYSAMRPLAAERAMSKLAALIATPVALAVLAAHFVRSGRFALAAVALAAVALLFVRRQWAARTLQVALGLGALEWLRTLAALVAERQSLGLPYGRLVLILGVVAVATALCAVAFESRTVRARYGADVGKAITGTP